MKATTVLAALAATPLMVTALHIPPEDRIQMLSDLYANVNNTGEYLNDARLKYPEVREKTSCINGEAKPKWGDSFACKAMDLTAFSSHAFMIYKKWKWEDGYPGSAVWGWESADGREFAILGHHDKVEFLEIDHDGTIHYVGMMEQSNWSDFRDFKVMGNFAYFASEGFYEKVWPAGVRVFDMRNLLEYRKPDRFGRQPKWLDEVIVFDELKSTHSKLDITNFHRLIPDPERGLLYGTGAFFTDAPNGQTRGATCRGGLMTMTVNNIQDPRPKDISCWANDGYLYDMHCVTYLIDISHHMLGPEFISRTPWPEGTSAPQHGAVTDKNNIEFLLVSDAWDEADRSFANGRAKTYIFNVTDLANPIHTGTYSSPAAAADAQIYVKDGLAYQANCGAGVRVIDVSGLPLDPTGGNIIETAFFDVHPEDDMGEWPLEAWGANSIYPFLKNNRILVNSVERGVFVLEYRGPTARFAKPAN